MSKQRVTVTVNPEVVAAGRRAVAAGEAESLSAWVDAAMADRADLDRRLAGLRSVIAEYEAEFGEITADEMEAQARKDAAAAIVIRGPVVTG